MSAVDFEPGSDRDYGDENDFVSDVELEDAYELDDPKHPSYHSRMSDLWDIYREGK